MEIMEPDGFLWQYIVQMKRGLTDKIKPWQVSMLVGIIGAGLSVAMSAFFRNSITADMIYKPMIIGMPMSYFMYRNIWKHRNLLQETNNRLEQALTKITILSRTDSLTGLLNRGAFFRGTGKRDREEQSLWEQSGFCYAGP